MCPTLQIVRTEPDVAEPGVDDIDVSWFTAVARASDRQSFVGRRVSCSGTDEGNRLDGLEGGPWKHVTHPVASRPEHAPVGVDRHDIDFMAALDVVTAEDVDDQR